LQRERWRMVDRDGCVVANTVPFSNTAPSRAGIAATILNAWLICIPPCRTYRSPVWGWSRTNDVKNSNHLSALPSTSRPQIPVGLRTMPAARIAKVREGLRLFEVTIYWGADWGRADEMHDQIGYRRGDARLANFADRLNRGHLGIYGQPAAPPPPPTNEINREAAAAAAWIGERLFDGERPCKDCVGRYADFTGGSIYWHPAVNVWPDKIARAIAVPKNIYETWAGESWEQGTLGYPVRRHAVIEGVGDIQGFQGGTIYRRYGQPGFFVHGAIEKRWHELGRETGAFGWLTSNERDAGGGTREQTFQHGILRWHPSGVDAQLTQEN
ncbi:LGFP repeat-containing protein, partial [Rhodococcus rhodnii]